jgi:hypothetical protein
MSAWKSGTQELVPRCRPADAATIKTRRIWHCGLSTLRGAVSLFVGSLVANSGVPNLNSCQPVQWQAELQLGCVWVVLVMHHGAHAGMPVKSSSHGIGRRLAADTGLLRAAGNCYSRSPPVRASVVASAEDTWPETPCKRICGW